jgi:hypothetical protein
MTTASVDVGVSSVFPLDVGGKPIKASL